MSSRISAQDEKWKSLSKEKQHLVELILQQEGALKGSIRRYPRKEGPDGRILIPMSLAQERLWFIDKLEESGAAYNVGVRVRLRGALDLRALHQGLEDLIGRHEALHTRFFEVEGVALQEIVPPSRFTLAEIDLTANANPHLEELVHAHASQHARAPFDLCRGPLIRGLLIRLGPQEHLLVITLHHIVVDDWSVRVILGDLATLYNQNKKGSERGMQALAIQYGDFSQWQRNQLESVASEQLAYWRDRLQGAPPELELPKDHPRPAAHNYRGESIEFALDRQCTARLRGFARERELTLFMVLCGAWAILLSRLSGQEDVVIGTPVSNRQRKELQDIVGICVNTLPLRVRVDRKASVFEFFRQQKEIALGAYGHQDLPFERLVDALKPERSLSRHPIFQVMFTLQSAFESDIQMLGLETTWEYIFTETSKFDLMMLLEEREDTIKGSLNFSSDLFEKETMSRWAMSYRVLVSGLPNATGHRVADLPMLANDERQLVIHGLNATRSEYGPPTLVHNMFENQARLTPDRVALTFGRSHLSYAELSRRANRLAHDLRRKGIGAGCPVGICAARGIDLVVGALGILISGGSYVPLDPGYPAERLQYMVNDAGLSLILIDRTLRHLIWDRDLTLIELESRGAERELNDADLPPDDGMLDTEKPVYVIYTSGSTGRPKGTRMPHRAMHNLIEWHRRTLNASAGRRVLQFAALSFDVAFQEIFTTLCTGATLVLLEEEIRKDVRALSKLLYRQQVDTLFIPPLMLQSIAECHREKGPLDLKVRDVITAGEQLRISAEVVEFFRRLPGCRLHNHYGPTETHVVTALTLTGEPGDWPQIPSIGRPIGNTQIYVLDDEQQPVPIGVTGEIYVAGLGVALGYQGRADLTAQRFVRDPFCADQQLRMYRTGDLGRWRSDGGLDYLGRNDSQVKLRGYRIELGEIEVQLARYEQVKEIMVCIREDAPGEKRLVAYVVARGDQALIGESLRAYARAVLPEYMVPSAFVSLTALPLTPNGKLDRRALPPPTVELARGRIYEAPYGHVEEALAGLWRDLLKVDRVSRDDNFFDLGGHSLLVIRMLFQTSQRLGVDLKVTDLYRHPSIRALARRIRGQEDDDKFVELDAEASLESFSVGTSSSVKETRAVFLTGATGFVGRFVLYSLLRRTDATVYCLLREGIDEARPSRLTSMMSQWDLWTPEFEERVVAVPGDLARPHLGLSDQRYADLTRTIGSIYHCGASMNHLETYGTARAPNVQGVKELLRLAADDTLKTVNYISTLGVFNSSTRGHSEPIDEDSPIDFEKHSWASGYLASKWVGERIVANACKYGVPCNIVRLGLVWPDSLLGRYDERQDGYRLLKTCLLTGIGILNYRYDAAPVPVDFVADAIVDLGTRYSSGGRVFHIGASGRSLDNVFERCNAVAGTRLELLPFLEWIRRVRCLHDGGLALPIAPLLEFYERECMSLAEGRKISCERTLEVLRKAGIAMDISSDDLINVAVRGLLSRDVDFRVEV